MDENHLIGVYVKDINFLEPDFYLCEPSVNGYLIDKKNGNCTKADSSDSNIFSYTSPFTLSKEENGRRSSPHNWNKLLVIEGKFSELNSENKLLMFEFCKNMRHRKTQEINTKRIAWAFLVPLASDGSSNTNKHLKLQLYKVRKDCKKISHQDCNIYHLYSAHKLKKFFGALQISVKGVVPVKTKLSEKTEGESKIRPTTEEKVISDTSPTIRTFPKALEWSRLPSQSCKVPNKIHKTHNLGRSGLSCLQFSRNGAQIAAAALSYITVFDVLTGEEVVTLNSHIGFIYELDWSFDDQFLLSVSSDCRGAVWSLTQKTPLFILPHPSYVYCGRWFGSNDHIITGGRDHLLRHWSRHEDGFNLTEEISGHSGFINALTTQDDSVIFSGDSQGCVMIRKYSESNWVLLKEITPTEMYQSVIDSIHVHSSRRRIVVSVRSRGSYLIDVVSGVVLQTYKSAINTFARSMSSLTPCGSFLFSFCQNGDVGVWETNTGKLFATYESLFPIDRLCELSGFIHYHPYEHMMGITALGSNHPLLLLKFDPTKDDSKKLGLSFKHLDKKNENENLTQRSLTKSLGKSG